jgi:hypothetical protein
MRGLNEDARKVLLGAAFLAIFVLGLVLGAKVERGLARPAAVAARAEVAR